MSEDDRDVWEKYSTPAAALVGGLVGRGVAKRSGVFRHPKTGRKVPTLQKHIDDTSRDFKAELGHKPKKEDIDIMREQYYEFYDLPVPRVSASVKYATTGAAVGAGGDQYRKRRK